MKKKSLDKISVFTNNSQRSFLLSKCVSIVCPCRSASYIIVVVVDNCSLFLFSSQNPQGQLQPNLQLAQIILG